MSDLRTLLHEAAGPSDTITSREVADADLLRARRSLRRRRVSRVGAASGLVAAAAIGALAIVGPSSPALNDSPGSTPSSSAVALVAYAGPQPRGIILDKVPVGWTVRDSTRGLLTIVPEGSTNDQSGSPGSTSLEGTIAVMVQRDTGVPTDVKLDQVTVDGRPAVIAHMKGSGDTRTLFAKQPSGAYLQIQVWEGLGWDNAAIAEFASSVHVTKDAELSVG